MSDTTETETDTNTNTDEPSKAELHDRVQQLESTVAKMMPSRRDALKFGAAGIAGAAGLGAASQSAEASTGSAGQIGDSSNRPDVFADTVNANNVTGARQGCRVILNTNQSISVATEVKIQFDSIVYDSDNNFDISSHSWACPEGGLYAVSLQAHFQGGGLGQQRDLLIGSETNEFTTNVGGTTRRMSSDPSAILSTSTINKYAQNDTIAAYVKNSDQSDELKGGTNNVRTIMEVAFLGGL